MTLPIFLSRESSIPLKQQLYEEIRSLILSGRWSAGFQLPSSRILSEELGVSRPTISWACAQLLNDGYIQTIVGSGTFVSQELPSELLNAGKTNNSDNHSQSAISLPLSARGLYLQGQSQFEPDCGQYGPKGSRFEIDFREGQPSLAHVPIKEWRGLSMKHYCGDTSVLGYGMDPRGYLPLRQALSRYLFRARSIRCSPEQVIIVGGSQQGLHVIGQVHIDPGDPVAVEDPGYQWARQVFQSFGAQLWPIPVDQSGLQVSTLEAFNTIKFKNLFLTPSHQFPLGSVLSLARRIKLVRWAHQSGSIIIEDDHDSEFRYCGPPIPALAALDNLSSVVYVGTFSKALFPSLRIGYLVVPERLVDVYARAKKLTDCSSPVIDQCVLADFINNGSFEKHIRRMRKLYEQKRGVLVKALQEQLGELVSVLGENAGLFLPVRFKTNLDDMAIIRAAASQGIAIRSTRHQYVSNTYTKSEFLINFGNIEEKLLKEGARRLAKIIRG